MSVKLQNFAYIKIVYGNSVCYVRVEPLSSSTRATESKLFVALRSAREENSEIAQVVSSEL